MNNKSPIVYGMVLSVLLWAQIPVFCLGGDSTDKHVHLTPESVVKELYNLVSFEAGTEPDWEKVRDLFIEEAVIVLRLGPTTKRTFTRQSFIDYFIYDIERANLKKSGFKETIIRSQFRIIKDIAHSYVLYEVSVPGLNDNKPVNRGIDSFHLVKKNGLWYIASIMNEGFRMDEPLPEFFDKK
jgi:hypothetical protein